MAKAPKDRYPSIRDLMDDIDRVLAGAGVFRASMPTLTGALPAPSGAVITGPPSQETHTRTKPRALLLAVAGLLAAAAIGVILFLALGRSGPEETPATAATSTAASDPSAAPSPAATAAPAGTIEAAPPPSAQPETSAQPEAAQPEAPARVEAPGATAKGPPRLAPTASASAKPKNPILGF